MSEVRSYSPREVTACVRRLRPRPDETMQLLVPRPFENEETPSPRMPPTSRRPRAATPGVNNFARRFPDFRCPLAPRPRKEFVATPSSRRQVPARISGLQPPDERLFLAASVSPFYRRAFFVAAAPSKPRRQLVFTYRRVFNPSFRNSSTEIRIQVKTPLPPLMKFASLERRRGATPFEIWPPTANQNLSTRFPELPHLTGPWIWNVQSHNRQTSGQKPFAGRGVRSEQVQFSTYTSTRRYPTPPESAKASPPAGTDRAPAAPQSNTPASRQRRFIAV